MEDDPTMEQLVEWVYESRFNVVVVNCDRHGTDYYDKYTKEQLRYMNYEDLYEICVSEGVL